MPEIEAKDEKEEEESKEDNYNYHHDFAMCSKAAVVGEKKLSMIITGHVREEEFRSQEGRVGLISIGRMSIYLSQFYTQLSIFNNYGDEDH